jgi:hypothetical protein
MNGLVYVVTEKTCNICGRVTLSITCIEPQPIEPFIRTVLHQQQCQHGYAFRVQGWSTKCPNGTLCVLKESAVEETAIISGDST